MLTLKLNVAPVAIIDLNLPNHVNPDVVAEISNFRSTQDPAIVQRHSLREAVQCQMFQGALNCFAQSQPIIFENLRSVTLEIRFHYPVHALGRGFIDHCGLTLRVKILLDAPPPDAADAIMHRLLTQKKVLDVDLLNLEPRRRMLAPLAELRYVRGVEIHRK